MAGARLEAQYPISVITDGMGLNITVMSYCGKLDFGIVADREQIQDVWPLMERMADALDELHGVICGSGRRSRARRRQGSGDGHRTGGRARGRSRTG
jgi:WS/DGAT C-terminal domain